MTLIAREIICFKLLMLCKLESMSLICDNNQVPFHIGSNQVFHERRRLEIECHFFLCDIELSGEIIASFVSSNV